MSDLLDLARSVVERARPGEQVEAYVSRDGETSVRVYEGEIEQLISARSEGIGVRVIHEGRVEALEPGGRHGATRAAVPRAGWAMELL